MINNGGARSGDHLLQILLSFLWLELGHLKAALIHTGMSRTAMYILVTKREVCSERYAGYPSWRIRFKRA